MKTIFHLHPVINMKERCKSNLNIFVVSSILKLSHLYFAVGSKTFVLIVGCHCIVYGPLLSPVYCRLCDF